METPLWMQVAAKQIGVREVPGAKSNPTILGWAKTVGSRLGITYSDDATPWCGLFAAFCMTAAGIAPPKIAVRAKAWLDFGIPLDIGIEGAVLVFERAAGGHVGFYVGENATAYRVLGGNQGDAVGYAWIAKDRCVGIRWPSGVPMTMPRKIFAGGPLSTNEA